MSKANDKIKSTVKREEIEIVQHPDLLEGNGVDWKKLYLNNIIGENPAIQQMELSIYSNVTLTPENRGRVMWETAENWGLLYASGDMTIYVDNMGHIIYQRPPHLRSEEWRKEQEEKSTEVIMVCQGCKSNMTVKVGEDK